jgi:hypothetical protein
MSEMNDQAEIVARLHETLTRRETPESVAATIDAALPRDVKGHLRGLLRRVVQASVKRHFGWSSMTTSFHGPVPMDRQIAKARELAGLFLDRRLPGSDDPDELESFIAALNELIGKAPGRSSFKHDRLNRGLRAELGLELSRRRYAKLFRLAGRLEHRLRALRREETRHRLVLVGKAALAPDLMLEDLAGHLPSAAFIAYYAARMKLRSEFTIDGQQRPFDGLAASLLKSCFEDPGTRWYAIAHVFPRADVLARLEEEEKGRLLGRWYDILSEIAEQLEIAWSGSGIDLETMVVKRGNDSSSWNLLAGAWNRARDHWIALVEALELDALLETMLPGKVMRLMAGDVAAWHRVSGGGIHPDTLIWRDLPKPWAVLRGELSCTRAQVEAACRRHGVDPVKSGWSAARARTEVAEFRPTPELVHGVTVDNPYLAKLFRQAGIYSGKSARIERLTDLLND